MPRASPFALLLLAACATRAADVFVIADTANQTRTIADAAKESIAEANDVVLANENETLSDPDFDGGPVVRKKRTFGDIVFRGLADVLGYNVARKPPQIVFPPPLAPVPGIDGPLQAIPVAVLPVISAAAAPAPASAAPAPAPAAPAPPPPCGRAAAPLPCRAQAPPPPQPKPAPPPCPRPRANPRPKPRPRPQPPPKPAPPTPCGSPRANPTTTPPCTPTAPAPPPPKADSNLETITSNFRLDFNFNRAPATQAVPVASETVEVQAAEEEQEQIVPVAIQPQAAKLPPEPPRNPRIYLDAFVVRNGVAQKVQAVDAQHLNQHQADNDYLVYDEEQIPQDQDDDYEDVQESQDRAKAVREFGNAVDRFWGQKQKPKKKLPENDYRNVHFGDRELANQLRRRDDNTHQSLQRERVPTLNRIPLPIPNEEEEEEESTTTTQDPRRPLKPRVLPPTEHNPNQIDTVTVRVPPIYKEKRPKKLHRERSERPNHDEEAEEDHRDTSHHEYSRRESPRHGYEERDDNSDTENSETENSELVYQTEQPKRKRRRKNRRKIRSSINAHYTAGDYDYYGKKIPISKEEEYFRGLTIPPPTKDADLARLEEAQDGNGHFLDDHERIRDDSERIKGKRKNRNNRQNEESEEKQSADESQRSDKHVHPKAGESESEDENERTDRISPKARVHETGHQTNYVHTRNVQVDDPQPSGTTAKKKQTKIAKTA